ncbi:MAG: hypothetical protein BWY95_02502 [Bacteroidetes bacterium ADurb.BinA104]|nr:MAG: hypothetical protein BWY95_02502 [Bacteroidetes bacterium ADurb.BinA104]
MPLTVHLEAVLTLAKINYVSASVLRHGHVFKHVVVKGYSCLDPVFSQLFGKRLYLFQTAYTIHVLQTYAGSPELAAVLVQVIGNIIGFYCGFNTVKSADLGGSVTEYPYAAVLKFGITVRACHCSRGGIENYEYGRCQQNDNTAQSCRRS